MPNEYSYTITASGWQTLPKSPVDFINADHRVEIDLDDQQRGKVRLRPGYSTATVRYTLVGGR